MTAAPDIDRTRETLDRDIATWLDAYRGQGGRIWCTSGCGGCCSLVVNTTYPEAAAIAASLDDRLRGALQAYLTRLRALLPGVTDFKSFLKVHRQQLGCCPFLDEQGCCAIYPQRPLSCRALLSTRPADWCAIDFTTLHKNEQRAFLASLDPAVVDYPSHYVAATRASAQHLEQQLLTGMTQHYGFALGGHLPSLVWLAGEHDLEQALPGGIRAVIALAERTGLGAPWLLQFHDLKQGADRC